MSFRDMRVLENVLFCRKQFMNSLLTLKIVILGLDSLCRLYNSNLNAGPMLTISGFFRELLSEHLGSN